MSSMNGGSGQKNSRVSLPEVIEKWNEYFLWMAEVVALKSKDPRSKVGAVIVSQDKVVLATGFNGLARGVFDDEAILEDQAEKLKWICHAEMNAIANAARKGVAVMGSRIFVNKFPCLACCNAVAQSGVIEIVTHDHKYWDGDPADSEHFRKASILKQTGISVIAPFHPDFSPARPVGGTSRRKASPRVSSASGRAGRSGSSKKLRPRPH